MPLTFEPGFDPAAEVPHRDPRDHWRVLRRLLGYPPLPLPEEDPVPPRTPLPPRD